MAVYGGFTGATPFKARDAYYKGTYGVSYSQFRTLQRKAVPEGMTGSQTRSTLKALKDQGLPPKASVERMISEKAEARQAYREGRPVEFDAEFWAQFDGVDEQWLWYH